EVEVLLHAEGRIEVFAEALRHVGDAGVAAAAMRGVAHVSAENRYLARLDAPHACEKAEKRRLADAVRADQPGHAAGRNVEGHVVEGGRAAVAVGQRPDPGRGRGARR